jgi:hypothetical protein
MICDQLDHKSNRRLGRFEGESNAAYQAEDAISKSRLDVAAKSLRKYYARFVSRTIPSEITNELIVGQATHDALLLPELFASGYVTAPDDAPKRPSSSQINAKRPAPATLEAIDFWSKFDAEAAGKIQLTAEQYAVAERCADAVATHPIAGPLFCGGAPEVSYYAADDETGALIKCRVDYERLDMDAHVDLKTTTDASEDAFGRHAHKFRYPVQGVWYPHVVRCTGLQAPSRFIFVAVEKEEPHDVGVYYLDKDVREAAWAVAQRDRNRIVACQREYDRTGSKDAWPDAGFRPRPLKIPPYAIKDWKEAA